MKKKFVFTFVFTLLVFSIYAQVNNRPQPVKYGIKAPDGSISITIYNDFRSDKMQLESVHSFYKYQLLDLMTSEPVYAANNKGTVCTINKSTIAEGKYKLRVYTKHFVITSTITIAHTPSLASVNEELLAMID